MLFDATAPALTLWCAAIVSAFTAAQAWRLRRRTPGGRGFAAMTIAIVVWCLADGLEAAAVGVPDKVLFSSIGYAGITAVPPLFLSFALGYRGKGHGRAFTKTGLIWLIPVVTLGFVVTNSRYHLMWTSFTPSQVHGLNIVVYGHGLWYTVWVLYAAMTSLIANAVLLESAFAREAIYRRQGIALLAGSTLPWIGTALYLSQANPIPGMDFSAVGFALGDLAILFGIRRFKLFEIVPVFRDDYVDEVPEGIVVLNADHRVVKINRAALRFLALYAPPIGRHAAELIAAFGDLGLSGGHATSRATTVALRMPADPGRTIDVTVSRWSNRTSRGVVLVLSARQSAAAPSNLVTMCASCRMVRDRAGRWHDLEHFVEHELGRHFTHGICSECVAKIYPDLQVDG